MDAVVAAQRLNWRQSAAYDLSLSVPVDPVRLYEFNARLAGDPEFVQRLTDDVAPILARTGLGDLAPFTVSPEQLAEVQLSDEELDALKQVAVAAQEKGLLGELAVEGELAAQGYMMPAIAVLVLAVAVGLWVWLWSR